MHLLGQWTPLANPGSAEAAPGQAVSSIPQVVVEQESGNSTSEVFALQLVHWEPRCRAELAGGGVCGLLE